MFALPFFRRDLPVLTSERIVMRMPVVGDYRDWAGLRNESRSFLEHWEPRWSPEELDRNSWRLRLGRYREDFASGVAIAFFIFEKRSGKLVGGITLGNIRYGVSQSGHIGYWVGARYAGQGFMTEAVTLLCRYAFNTLKLHRVEAACIPENNRSIRVLEKAGFQREGLLRSYLKINGFWQDHYLYGRICDDRNDVKKKG